MLYQGEGSSPFSCRKYLRMVFSVFHKIYAHKWLYTAVCGHKIFFVSVSWLGRKDLNPRNGGVRVHCLTTWRRPNFYDLISIPYFQKFVNTFSKKISKNHKNYSALFAILLIPLFSPQSARRFYRRSLFLYPRICYTAARAP